MVLAGGERAVEAGIPLSVAIRRRREFGMQPSSNPPPERPGPGKRPIKKANPQASRPQQQQAPLESADWPDDYEPAEEGSAEKLRKRPPPPPSLLGTLGKTEILFTTQTNFELNEDV